MSNNRSAFRASLWGFLVGSAAGVVLGVTLAPNEGRRVRQRAAFLFDQWAGQVSGLAERLSGEGVVSDARNTADAIVADAREQAEKLLNEADALISEARSRRSTGSGSETGTTLRRAS